MLTRSIKPSIELPILAISKCLHSFGASIVMAMANRVPQTTVSIINFFYFHTWQFQCIGCEDQRGSQFILIGKMKVCWNFNYHQVTDDDVDIDLMEEKEIKHTFGIHTRVDSNKEPKFFQSNVIP